jgi:hypothetical protein
MAALYLVIRALYSGKEILNWSTARYNIVHSIPVGCVVHVAPSRLERQLCD